MHKFFLFYFLTLPLANSLARIGEWQALTSILNVRDIIFTEEAIYAASSGGVLEIKNNQYSTYTTINGLNGVNLSCMALDHQSNLWIGGQSPFGFLQVYDIQKKESISSFEFGLTSIIDIQLNGMTAWVLFQQGVDIGLMKFIFDDGWQYRDSFNNYPEALGYINCFTSNDSMVFIGMKNGLLSVNALKIQLF